MRRGATLGRKISEERLSYLSRSSRFTFVFYFASFWKLFKFENLKFERDMRNNFYAGLLTK